MRLIDKIKATSAKFGDADQLARIEAKRKAVEESAREAYVALCEGGIAGVDGWRNGTKCRLDVTLHQHSAEVRVVEYERKVVKTHKGDEVRWVNPSEVSFWWGVTRDDDTWCVSQPMGATKEFAQLEDALDYVARRIGEELEVA